MQEAARKSDVILDAVGFAAERFLRARRREDAMDEVLAALGQAIASSRLQVYHVHSDDQGNLLSSLQHEWVTPGVEPQIGNPLEQAFPLVAGGYARWIDVLGSGETLAGVRDDFPQSERQFLLDEEIRSVLVVPIFVDEEWWGWIGFDECVTDRRWTQVETDALRATAGIIGAAIQREREGDAREQAEERYATLVEQIPAVTYVEEFTDPYSSVIYISPQIESMLGYPQQMWIDDPHLWERIMDPADHENAMLASDLANQTLEPYVAEYRMLAKDGRVIWVRDQAVPVFDAEGVPKYWQGVMIDMTEARESAERLAATESRYRTLVEQIPAITYIEEAGRSGHLLYVSPQIETILGHAPEEWLEDEAAWSKTIHPDDLAVVKRAADEGDANGRVSVEYRVLAADSRTVWFRDESKLVYDSAGSPLFWQGVMHDITDQKAAAERIHETEERYRALVEQIPAITYIDDRSDEGRIAYMSPQIETLTGHAAAEFMKDRDLWFSLIHPDDRDRVAAYDEEVQATGNPFVIDYRMVSEDGRESWIHDEAVVVHRDEKGDPVYWQGVMVDVTERKRAEDLQRALDVERETSQRLRDLDDMKNTFLTAVSHDLRTPLAAILGLAITLERDDIDLAARESQDLTRRIAANARKLDRLVTDLLDLDRLSRGILEPQRHPTDVGALVRKVVNEGDFLTDHPVQVEADPVILAVDGAKVERIVENLLANAVRHTSVGTQIWIKVNAAEDGVLIAVDDAGPGVPDELRTAVFEPFRQGLEGGPSPGVGIGLSLVARFSELHGGRAWVEDREGGGASFRVFLPGGPSGTTHFP